MFLFRVLVDIAVFLGEHAFHHLKKPTFITPYFSLLATSKKYHQVETWWFHIIATLVIGANTVTIVLEADSPAMVKKFSWFECLNSEWWRMVARKFIWRQFSIHCPGFPNSCVVM